MSGPLREQAHFHRFSELAEISGQTTIPWEPSLLAKTYFQSPENVAECRGLFVSKLTPTGSVHGSKSQAEHHPVGAELARENLLSVTRKSG